MYINEVIDQLETPLSKQFKRISKYSLQNYQEFCNVWILILKP